MQFTFQAKNQVGELVQGLIDAPSEDQAILILQQKNLFIIGIDLAPQSLAHKDLFAYFHRPGRKDVVVFTRQLATLIDAEVPLLEALTTLARQTDKESFRKVVQALATAVEGGASLSIALNEHESVFTRFYVSLVKVGEVSGRLQETLIYLADYLERSASLNSKIKSALFYPAFILFALVTIGTIMMITVVPQLLAVIKDSGVTELPLPTRILLWISASLNSSLIFLIVILIAITVGLYQYIRTPAGHYRWDSLLLRIPRFGKIFQNFYLARFAETLATLIKAGVPILDSLEICSDVVGNDVYRDILREARTNVQAGGTISATMLSFSEVPSLVGSMIQTGEKTGRTVAMLENVLKFYKGEAEASVQNLSQLIEPILMIVLGLGVGILVAAVLLPIYSLVSAN